MSEQMQVVISGSQNLYPYFPCMYESLFAHNPDAKLWILIEDEKLPYETPENVECVDISKQTVFPSDGPNSRSPFTYLAMIRAAYPLLFTGVENGFGIRPLPRLDRIISMDVDVVVCDSLRPIWDTEFKNGEWFAAVPQFKSNSRPYGFANRYFNAGIMVYNLEQMRKDKVAEKAIELLNRQKFTFLDEQVFNLLNMYEGDTKFVDLHPRWNQHLEVPQTIDRVGCIHYAGIKMIWQQDIDMIYRGCHLEPYLKYNKEAECRAAGIEF